MKHKILLFIILLSLTSSLFAQYDEKKILNTYLDIVYKTIKWIPTTGGTIARLYNKSINETKILVPPLSVQQEIVTCIEEEQKYVDGCKRLIEIYEKKIKDRIGKVWGD